MAKKIPLKTCFLVWLLVTLFLGVTAFTTKVPLNTTFDPANIPTAPEYNQTQNWITLPNADKLKKTDVFFVHPTTFFSKEEWNQQIPDARQDNDAIFSIKSQAGVFNKSCNVYAPFYRQASMSVLDAGESIKTQALDVAYQDVEKAFDYYMANYNKGRPFILAGHSQGSNLLLWLLERKFSDPKLQKKLVAAYIIGWAVTKADIEKYPHLKLSSNPNQTGCIISYNTQSQNPSISFVQPDTICVNPLLWNTSNTAAPNTLNLGAVIYNDSGKHEIPFYTSATVIKGALVIPSPQKPELLDLPNKGFYHAYDYSFFYRNIEQNAQDRVISYHQQQIAKNK